MPVGRYAQTALEAAKLWPALQAKAVGTLNVRQSLDYVARGEVDAGFVYATDAALMKDKVKVAFEVPLDFLLDPRNVHELEVDWQGRRRRLLEYRFEGHRIWGATAAMLVNFRRRLEQAT